MDQLLTTKLFIPKSRSDLVARPRLIEKLNDNLSHKLVLISAPAGYGKTTLVTAWLHQIEASRAAQVCWLSLDKDDSEPQQFFRYLAAAVRSLPDVRSSLFQLLQANQSFSAKTLMKAFLHDVTAISSPFIFVLDDYHTLDSAEIDDALATLSDLMPPQMTLVLTSRSDPGFPISRLRARGELVELRADDLRFTEAEATQFMQETMHLSLQGDQITALEKRTEGWIVGLQMAAISMQGRSDTTGFIQAFTGSHRYIVDYLVDEVLQNQPEHVRSFLYQTSILRRLSGPLCDVVTGQEESKVLLQTLERDNMFVVPLDDHRQWYRYHHLFTEVLHAHLSDEQSAQVPVLHRRASEWYEQNDMLAEAVHHAFVAEDFERAAYLTELAWRAMTVSYQSVTWLNWVKALPDELVRARPVLSVGYSWALLDTGELEAAESRLRDAELWLNPAADTNVQFPKTVVVDEDEFQALPRTIANARAYLAQALGNAPSAIKYAQQALDLLIGDDFFERSLAVLLLGFAYWSNGDMEAAYRAIADAVSNMQKAGNLPFTISFTSYLADILTAQGCLSEAIRTYSQLLETVLEQGEPVIPETAVLYLGLSELYHEQGDIEAARWHLLKGEELGEQPAFPPWYRHWFLAQARMKRTENDLDGVIDMLISAERMHYRHPIPDVRPLAALKTRTWLAQGRLAEAWGWVNERGLSADDNLSYMREFEHLTLARVLIAQYKNNQDENAIRAAMGLLERLLLKAEEGRRIGSIIEILALQALANEAQGNTPLALKPLKRALTLAEPENYVQVFVDEGLPMASLLQAALQEGISVPYATQLLAAIGKDAGDEVTTQPLVDPLSEREMEILALIAEGLKNQEIADKMVISLNTVLYHTKNIYNKLGVNKRTQAVLKARELNLL